MKRCASNDCIVDAPLPKRQASSTSAPAAVPMTADELMSEVSRNNLSGVVAQLDALEDGRVVISDDELTSHLANSFLFPFPSHIARRIHELVRKRSLAIKWKGILILVNTESAENVDYLLSLPETRDYRVQSVLDGILVKSATHKHFATALVAAKHGADAKLLTKEFFEGCEWYTYTTHHQTIPFLLDLGVNPRSVWGDEFYFRAAAAFRNDDVFELYTLINMGAERQPKFEWLDRADYHLLERVFDCYSKDEIEGMIRKFYTLERVIAYTRGACRVYRTEVKPAPSS